MLNWKWQNNAGINMIYIPEWQAQGVSAGFTSRMGGTSTIPFASLNLGLHVGDDYERVIENRTRTMAAFGAKLEQMVCCQQVHGDEIAVVGDSHISKGALALEDALPGYDAMITCQKGTYLTTFYADCYPVFFFDSYKRVVGIAHSGWKGTMSAIAVKTVSKMNREFGSSLNDIQVFIGPGIGPCCFKIDEDLTAKVIKKFGEDSRIIMANEKGFFWNLPKTIYKTLIDKGIREDNIALCELCTSCHPEMFFSYRRDGGLTGRMAAVIALEF